jgi:hypothetical protein
MVKGEGMAENCVGFLSLDGSDIINSPCVWADKSKVCNIPRDLRIFELVKEENTPASVQFATASSDMFLSNTGIPYAVNSKSYSECLDAEIIVKIGSKNAFQKILF